MYLGNGGKGLSVLQDTMPRPSPISEVQCAYVQVGHKVQGPRSLMLCCC